MLSEPWGEGKVEETGLRPTVEVLEAFKARVGKFLQER
jgi:hypothetical protein